MKEENNSSLKVMMIVIGQTVLSTGRALVVTYFPFGSELFSWNLKK